MAAAAGAAVLTGIGLAGPAAAAPARTHAYTTINGSGSLMGRGGHRPVVTGRPGQTRPGSIPGHIRIPHLRHGRCA